MSDPFLIDECLSAELPPIAHEFGFEAYHVAHFGLAGAPDHAVLAKVRERGFIFVTNNRDDFVELVEKVDLHAGLIVFMSQAAGMCRRPCFGRLSSMPGRSADWSIEC